MKMIVRTLASGNNTRYAANTPAMAPLAPRLGTEEPGSIAICVMPAITPQNR